MPTVRETIAASSGLYTDGHHLYTTRTTPKGARASRPTPAHRSEWWLGRRFSHVDHETVRITVTAYETDAIGHDAITIEYRDAGRTIAVLSRAEAESHVRTGRWIEA